MKSSKSYQSYVWFRNMLYHNKMVLSIYSFFFTTLPNLRQSKRLQLHGLNDLQQISEVFKESGFEAFCEFGTLLGLIREGGFIPHDIDIDMGIIEREDFSWNRVRKAFEQKGIMLDHYHSYNGRITEQTYIMPSGLTVDFFLYVINDDSTMTTLVYYKDHDRTYKDPSDRSVKALTYNCIEGITSISIMDHDFLVPSNAAEHLSEIYGPSWRVPDPHYKPDRKDNVLPLLGSRFNA